MVRLFLLLEVLHETGYDLVEVKQQQSQQAQVTLDEEQHEKLQESCEAVMKAQHLQVCFLSF